MIRPLYIFDLDGTLSLTAHRDHLVQQDPPDWAGYFRASARDLPNYPVVRTLQRLVSTGAEIQIWSGRSDEVISQTHSWLRAYVSYGMERNLRMRPQANRTPDAELKRQWYMELDDATRDRIVAVFEDRQRVVDMWRAEGVSCFQVAPGKF